MTPFLHWTARQFLFVTVPPFSRTPLGLDGSYHAEFVRWVHIWNFRFAQMVGSFAQTFPEMHVRVWDMHQELNEVSSTAPSERRMKSLRGKRDRSSTQPCSLGSRTQLLPVGRTP